MINLLQHSDLVEGVYLIHIPVVESSHNASVLDHALGSGLLWILFGSQLQQFRLYTTSQNHVIVKAKLLSLIQNTRRGCWGMRPPFQLTTVSLRANSLQRTEALPMFYHAPFGCCSTTDTPNSRLSLACVLDPITSGCCIMGHLSNICFKLPLITKQFTGVWI